MCSITARWSHAPRRGNARPSRTDWRAAGYSLSWRSSDDKGETRCGRKIRRGWCVSVPARRRAICCAAIGSRRCSVLGIAGEGRRAGARAPARRRPRSRSATRTARIGLVDAYCPHRRAPLFFGRNEECGLRCVYHGWKFDADGNCVDMPSRAGDQPDEEQRQDHRLSDGRARRRRLGLYGPEGHAAARRPITNGRARPRRIAIVSKTFEDCNYLQALEGGLDTAHSLVPAQQQARQQERCCASATARRSIDVETTDYGYYYVSTRKPAADEQLRARLSLHHAGTADARQRACGCDGGRNDIAEARRPYLGADR